MIFHEVDDGYRDYLLFVDSFVLVVTETLLKQITELVVLK